MTNALDCLLGQRISRIRREIRSFSSLSPCGKELTSLLLPLLVNFDRYHGGDWLTMSLHDVRVPSSCHILKELSELSPCFKCWDELFHILTFLLPVALPAQ
jgi:hypothetical protein